MKKVFFTLLTFLITHMAATACTASFNYTVNPYDSLQITLTNTSTSVAPSNGKAYLTLYFGEGFQMWLWDTTTSATHIYTSPGNYVVSATIMVYDSASNLICMDSTYQTITVGQPCRSIFNYSISGINGPVTFTALDSTAPAGTIYTWDFGDGTSLTGSPVTHTYTTAGGYSVILTTSDTPHCYYTDTQHVSNIINCSNLHADFNYIVNSDTIVVTNLTTSIAATNIITRYSWNFSDGISSTSFSPTVVVPLPTDYRVSLIAITIDTTTNIIYCVDSMVQYILVTGSCAATFTDTLGIQGLVTCTANPSSFGNIYYSWDFGDNSAPVNGYGQVVTHSYAGNSNFRIILSSTNSLANCTSRDTQYVTISNVPATQTCAGLSAGFSYGTSNNIATFTNSSTPATAQGMATTYVWDYGDGSPAETQNIITTHAHTYANWGTYTVILITNAVNPNFTFACSDTAIHSVTVTNPLSEISGYITFDSTIVANAQFKIWLILDDTIAHTLTAVDSITSSTQWSQLPYTFHHPAAGMYLVKAMLLNGPTSGTTLVPTYGITSLYWNSPLTHIIIYSGSGASSMNNITMEVGAYTAGPGFISGSVFSGANKGTGGNGAPVSAMTILLEDATGNPVAYTTTDANGSYSFGNIAYGFYTVYPEVLGYETTPWANIAVAANGQTQVNFNQHTLSKTITPITTGVANVENSAGINLFPNPTNGIVNLTWAKALNNTHVTVMDVTGRKAMESDLILNGEEGHTQLNLSGLGSGVYFISVKADNATYNTKVILEH